jgi:hypothetical protein
VVEAGKDPGRDQIYLSEAVLVDMDVDKEGSAVYIYSPRGQKVPDSTAQRCGGAVPTTAAGAVFSSPISSEKEVIDRKSKDPSVVLACKGCLA